MGLPFVLSDGVSFSYLFYGVRYFFLFEMASASLWKLFRGTLFHVEQFSSILKIQRIEYVLSYPEAFSSRLTAFLLAHTFLAHAMWIFLFLLQFSFLAGFFTRRFDLALLCAYLLFSLGSYFLMNMFTLVFENTIFLLTLIPWQKLLERNFRNQQDQVQIALDIPN